MFENILHQTQVITRLKTDLNTGMLAPSVLFSGPGYSGKGTTALELARILGCEDLTERGGWNCVCPSCVRHRNLVSPDLLLLGKRRFFEECSAASDTFLRNPANTGSKMLFIRSVRKILARFNGILWEDDPKLGKLKSQIIALEEELEDLELNGTPGNPENSKSIVKKAAKLEEELGELIPIEQIRKAAYWSRLAPLGRNKCIIIENAENMQERTMNSLLKILEETPPSLTIIITSSRPMSLLPTILSRLREYRFTRRSAREETEVISRIFRENLPESGGHTRNNQTYGEIESYLASFLPVNQGILYPLGAFFAASVAAEAVRERRAKKLEIPEQLIQFGKFAASIAEEGSMERAGTDAKNTIERVIGTAEGFEIPGLFTRFLQQCSVFISVWLRSEENNTAEKIRWADLWRKELNRSMTETVSFNVYPLLALERLFYVLKTGMA